MSKSTDTKLVEDVQAASTWDELQEVVGLEDAKAAIIAKERQRVSHKLQYLKRQKILRIAKEALERGDITLDD